MWAHIASALPSSLELLEDDEELDELLLEDDEELDEELDELLEDDEELEDDEDEPLEDDEPPGNGVRSGMGVTPCLRAVTRSRGAR